MLNIVLLIVCICITIASFIYLFFFNRFIAWLLGFAIRLAYWGDGASSIWLEIGSIHFSILSGRISLKDVRYHSSNQTIKIVKAQVAWRYWIRRPTSEEEITSSFGDNKSASARNSSCRIHVSLHGFEWFLYNRTAAYDNILSQMRAQPSPNVDKRVQKAAEPSAHTATASLLATSLRSRAPTSITNMVRWIRDQLPNLDPKDLLPLGLEASKGAIICGNPSTPNLLVAEFKRMEGTFGIVPSRSKYDQYKQMFNLSFTHALIQFTANGSYRDPMTSTGEVIENQVNSTPSHLSYSAFRKIWDSLKLYAPTLKYLHQNHTSRQALHWRRAKKSLDEDTPVGVDFAKLEYAIERKILETPLLELCYYADVVGIVPQSPVAGPTILDPFDIGNGDIGPEWGVDIAVQDGFIRYGPWADRQRGELQRAFFPPAYCDADETPRLRPGDERAWTALRVFVELRGETTLHIPFRESSKDWQWDGLTEGIERPRKREHALLHLTAGDRSTINYLMPMVASQRGYEPTLEVHLDTVAVTSSLNDIRLVAAETCRIHCGLPSPLKWNAQRTWSIGVILRRPTLYLIRDHINMFTDLGKDWSSGPPADYQRFVPTIYQFELDMHHYELNLYSNDHNIIDKPLLVEENAIFSLTGPRLRHTSTVPSNVYRPESSTISFMIDVPHVCLKLSLPRWNTNALHAPKGGNTLAKVGSFRMDGSYLYFSEVHEEYIEQLRLSFTVHDIVFKALGWSIRYIMILRDNYLGSFTHFSTLYEYLHKRKEGAPLGDPVMQKYRPGTSNMMHVELAVAVTDGLIVLPAGLPGYETGIDLPHAAPNSIGHCLALTVPELGLQFRMHDAYMEMTLNVGTISGCVEDYYPENLDYPNFRNKKSGDILVLDGLDIIANRLFGPAPRTITYVCLWEIQLGSVKASLSAFQAAVLQAAGKAFLVNFEDSLNAPADDYQAAVYPDLTFLKVSTGAVHIVWNAGHAALLVTIPYGLKFDHNDLGGQYHQKTTSIRLPHLSIKGLLNDTTSNMWLEAADIGTDLFLDIYSSPAGSIAKRAAQAKFVREQDKDTGRVERLLKSLRKERPMPAHRMHLNGVYLPQPTLLHSRSNARPKYALSTKAASGPSDVVQSSESEEEIQFGNAMRDVRVAASSRGSNVRQSDREDSLSFGDESDDEDLTEHSDSEWPESDSSDVGSDASMFKQYARFVRHHILRYGSDPAQWEDGPFILIKDNAFLEKRRHGSEAQSAERSPLKLSYPDDAKNTVVYRVGQRQGVEVKITPLAIPTFEALQSNLESTHFTPEFQIDNMMASYIDDFPGRSRSKIPSCAVLDIRLEPVRLHVLERVTFPSARDAGLEGHNRAGGFSHLACCVSDIHVSGELSGDDHSIVGGFSKAEGSLTSLSNNHRTRSQSSPALSFSIVNPLVTLFKDVSELHCAEFSTGMSHALPELLLSTVDAIASHAPRLTQLQRKIVALSPSRVHSTVYHVLRRSGNDSVIDPLSTIQPSFLVQTGIPQELRADPAFRFLFHLRNCLWHLRDSEASWDKDLGQNIEVGDLAPLLNERLYVLDPDVYNTSRLGSLEPLLPNIKSSPTWKMDDIQYPFSFVSVRLHLVRLEVVDPEGRPPCQVSFSDLALGVRLRHHDLLDLPDPPLSFETSQTSLRAKPFSHLQKVLISVTLNEIQVTIYSYLTAFVQESLRAQKLSGTLRNSSPSVRREKKARFPTFSIVQVHAIFLLNRFRLRAVAEKLTFEFGVSGMRHSTTLLVDRHLKKQFVNNSSLLAEIFLKARSTPEIPHPNEHDELASIIITGFKENSLLRSETSLDRSIKLAFTVGALHLTVPRSALRLYHFVEEWRADFLPGIEATIHTLMSEISKSPEKKARAPQAQSALRSLILQVNGRVSSAGVYLRVMHDTWLSWEVNDAVVHLNSRNEPKTTSHNFGVHLSSQIFSISSDSQESNSETRIKLELPPFLLSGCLEQRSIRVISLIRFLELKVRPSHWDTLLAVQQKFEQDFNDLLAVIHQTRFRRTSTTPSTTTTPPSKTTNGQRLEFSAFLKMEGFRVGFEGRSSVLYLECPGIGGKFESVPEKAWSVTLSDLALSLAPRSSIPSQSFLFNRHRRSAFVIIDFKVLSKSQPLGGSDTNEVLEVAVTKVHAVMQPSSIGEIGDFVDELQAELLDRREQRAHEMSAFKQKTQQLIKSFEVKTQEPVAPQTMPWLDRYIIEFSLNNIGVAFPLAHDHDMDLPPAGSHDTTAVRAFLFSIHSVKFGTQHGVTGQASMERFSFQFVPSFRQSVPADFSGDKHETHNRLLYPTMKAQLRSSRSLTSNQVYMSATVSGFIFDIDSTIPDYVFSLFDVYRRGKERVQRLSANLPRGGGGPISTDVGPDAKNRPEPQPTRSTGGPDFNFFASLTFLSGKVCMYSTDASKSSRIRAYSGTWDRPEQPMSDVGAEVFNLPVVSVWAEYRGVPPSRRNTGVEEPSILIFKSTVHSSHNTLRPMLLPFVTEVVTLIEARLRASNRAEPPPLSVEPTVPEATPLPPPSALRISFSLRIDQSRLELTCLPDVNVVAALHWDSGGFMVNVSPGARNVTFTGTVGGLTIGLKHGFLSEDCLRLDARNLAFSVTLGKPYIENGPIITSVSLVLDTEFLGGVRFSRLQDILCFKAVWLDRIPVFNGHDTVLDDGALKLQTAQPTNAGPKQEFTTAILVRVRQIKLDIDLGQSISTVVLHLENSALRTKLTDSSNEVSFRVGHVAITAKGNVAGYADVSNCVFQTIRWTGIPASETGPRERMLELRMTSGPLIVMLESDYQKLLHYRAEPLEVEILDDWSMILPQSNQTDRPLRLSFTVKSPEVVAVATVGTIPKLLAYANKFKANLEAQREGASRESTTFRISRAPKPDNPLSAVAEAMIHSARTRFKEADSTLSYIIKQHMSLRLDLLRLVVFPRTMADAEVAQFLGKDVRGRLDRLVESETTLGKRDIRLSFSSMKISRLTQLGHAVMPPSSEISDEKQWLMDLLKDANSADIVGLPSMTMHMTSEESTEGSQKILSYDFDSQFVRLKGVQHSEDIYITLNVGLYSWLTVLRKTLTREMVQVQSAADWRTTSANPAPARKRVPEPLDLADSSTRSATAPHSFLNTNPLSPLSPKSASALSPTPGSPPDSAVSAQFSQPLQLPSFADSPSTSQRSDTKTVVYRPGKRHIERLTMRQLGEATPDVMHPFFMKKAGFSLEDSLPQYVHEYATTPLEEIMEVLLKLYGKQLLAGATNME